MESGKGFEFKTMTLKDRAIELVRVLRRRPDQSEVWQYCKDAGLDSSDALRIKRLTQKIRVSRV